MLDQEVVNLSDRVQLLRQNNNNNNNNAFDAGGGGFPRWRQLSCRGWLSSGRWEFWSRLPKGGNTGTPDAGNNALATTLTVQTEVITSLKNDDFLQNKLPAFLSPEQVALIQKVKAADKEGTTCLGGLLDHISPLNQNNGNRGNNNRGNFNNNFNFNNNAKKTNGQAFCMTAEATASERLEPIRMELAKGNLPLAKDQGETIAEVFMKSQIKDLVKTPCDPLLTASFSGNRGGGNITSIAAPIHNWSSNPERNGNLQERLRPCLNPPRGGVFKVIGSTISSWCAVV